VIEVIPHNEGWRWRWISALGRTLVETFDTHPCHFSAWNAAKLFRTTFWAISDGIDHRQARCI
jgi:hypothetical protein